MLLVSFVCLPTMCQLVHVAFTNSCNPYIECMQNVNVNHTISGKPWPFFHPVFPKPVTYRSEQLQHSSEQAILVNDTGGDVARSSADPQHKVPPYPDPQSAKLPEKKRLHQ